jgi:hypothetical protein
VAARQAAAGGPVRARPAGRDAAGPGACRAAGDGLRAATGGADPAALDAGQGACRAATAAPLGGADDPARARQAGRGAAVRAASGPAGPGAAGPADQAAPDRAAQDAAVRAASGPAARDVPGRAGPGAAGPADQGVPGQAARQPIVPARAGRAGPAPAGRDPGAPAGWRGSAPAGHSGRREPPTDGRHHRQERRERLPRTRHRTAGSCRHRGSLIAACPRRLATRSRHDSSPPRPWRSASTRGPWTGPRVLWQVRRRADCSTSPHFLMFTLMFTRAGSSHQASAGQCRPQRGNGVLHPGDVGGAKGSLQRAPLPRRLQAIRLSTQIRTAARCRAGRIVSDRAIRRADDSVESALGCRATANHTGARWYNARTC